MNKRIYKIVFCLMTLNHQFFSSFVVVINIMFVLQLGYFGTRI